MHRVVGLQNRINQLSTQFAAKTEKKTKRHPVLYAVAGFLIAFALITSTPLKAITYPITIPFFSAGGMELQVMVWNIVNLVLSAIIGAVLYGVISKSADKGRERKNATIDQSNAQVEANNQALAQSIEQTKQEIFAVQQRWAAEVAPWYPMDYDNIDTVDFFLTAVRNHRASTVQEMVPAPLPAAQPNSGDGQPLRDRAASAPYGAGAAADSQPAAHRQHAAARQSVHAGAGSQPSPADKRKHRKRQQQPRLDCQRDGQAVAARRRTPLHGSWRFSPRSMQRAAYVE